MYSFILGYIEICPSLTTQKKLLKKQNYNIIFLLIRIANYVFNSRSLTTSI